MVDVSGGHLVALVAADGSLQFRCEVNVATP